MRWLQCVRICGARLERRGMAPHLHDGRMNSLGYLVAGEPNSDESMTTFGRKYTCWTTASTSGTLTNLRETPQVEPPVTVNSGVGNQVECARLRKSAYFRSDLRQFRLKTA